MGKIGALLSRTYGIEESIIGGAPKITAVGNGSVYIENHGGLLSYSDASLSLMCGITIEGGDLIIKEMDVDTISIQGRITCIKMD